MKYTILMFRIRVAAVFSLVLLSHLSTISLRAQQRVEEALGASLAQAFNFEQRPFPLFDTLPGSSENASLLQAVELSQLAGWPDNLQLVDDFIRANPRSPWNPSLRSLLAKACYDTGRYTLALEHWEEAWHETRAFETGPGKRIADYTLAHWTRLLASLGRYEVAAALIIENRERVLDQGPLSQRWARTREAVAHMARLPGLSYQCGTMAMMRVAKELGIAVDVAGLGRVPSPETGFTARMLEELSSAYGLGLVPVWRGESQYIPIPFGGTFEAEPLRRHCFAGRRVVPRGGRDF